MAVAASPAPNAMISTSRVPQTAWANRSWPYAVVPNGCALDGPRLRPYTSAFGWSRAMAQGKIATRQKNASRMLPAVAFRFDRMARAIRVRAAECGRPRAAGSAAAMAVGPAVPAGSSGPPGPTGVRIMAIASPRGPGAWIEQRRGHVGQQDGHQDRHGDQQEQRLHQRVVLVLHRLEQHEAHTGVVEDVLDQDRAADDEPERHGEAGEVRQDRVAGGVVVHDPAPRQSLGPRPPDVVLGQ